jgi:hypothetical protein
MRKSKNADDNGQNLSARKPKASSLKNISVTAEINNVPRQVWIPALCFTSGLILFLIVVFFVTPPINQDRLVILQLIYPLLGGFASFFLGGTVLLRMTGGSNTGLKMALSATGGAAVFFVCYFYPLSYPSQKIMSVEEQEVRDAGVQIEKMAVTYASMEDLHGSAQSIAASEVNKTGIILADRLLKLSDKRISNRWQIDKYVYTISALYKAAAADLLLAPPDLRNAIILSDRAIDLAYITLNKIKNVEELVSNGDKSAIEDLARIQEDDCLYKIKYYIAVAFAVNARSGGSHQSKEAISVLNEIPAYYKNRYPPENNPDLKWAFEQIKDAN